MVWIIGLIAALAIRETFQKKRSCAVAVAQEDEAPPWDDWSVSEAMHVLRGLPDEE